MSSVGKINGKDSVMYFKTNRV
jgi:hypothetical protein